MICTLLNISKVLNKIAYNNSLGVSETSYFYVIYYLIPSIIECFFFILKGLMFLLCPFRKRLHDHRDTEARGSRLVTKKMVYSVYISYESHTKNSEV